MTVHRFPGRTAVFGMTLIALSVSRAPGQGGEFGRDLSPFRSCGLNCLFVVAKLNDLPISLDSLGKVLAPSENGESSIADLERAATSLGLRPVSVKADMSSLADLQLPAIVHLKSRSPQSSASHYVVLLGLHRKGVMTIDPPSTTTVHPYDEFAGDWTGVAMSFPQDRARQDEILARHLAPTGRPLWLGSLAIIASCVFAAWTFLLARRRRDGQGDPSPKI